MGGNYARGRHVKGEIKKIERRENKGGENSRRPKIEHIRQKQSVSNFKDKEYQHEANPLREKNQREAKLLRGDVEYKRNIDSGGDIIFLRYIVLYKILNKVLKLCIYMPSCKYIILEEIKIHHVQLSVFDTHVKGGDCWSQNGFDN